SGSWTDIPTNGQFTQADIDASKIRFVSDGSEDHVSTFDYKVSDGTPNYFNSTFGLDITPTNDRPTASGGSAQVTEGNNNAVRLGSSVIGLGDVDLSQDESKRSGEGLADFLWFKITGLAVDGSNTARGALQRWDGDSWEAVTLDTTGWLPSTLVTATADGATSGLRYVHDGSEPLAYPVNPNLTFTYVVRDDLAAPTNFYDTSTAADGVTADTAQSNQSASATATIKIIPVNNAPQIADKPADTEPTITGTIASGGATTGVNEILANVSEGGTSTITAAMLTAIDSDNTTVQRQFLIKSLPTLGTLLLNGKALGVGSTFTQADIDANKLVYKHNGAETPALITDALGSYNDKFHFTVSDAVFNDDGAGATNWNSFLITFSPMNEPPTLTAPSSTVDIDSATAANNLVTGFVVADP
ncbi:cadherin-like domain-containing protein, partial [Chromatium okenii]|uniref:cadherin-like domain-containing protein n=1 Tax=Chromatium okenii TaxID=61644 RepID=UPI0026EEF27A